MSQDRELRIEDLPTVEELVNKSLRRGARLLDSGKSAEEITSSMEKRSVEFRKFLLAGGQLLEPVDQKLMEDGMALLMKAFLIAGSVALVSGVGIGRLIGKKFYEMPKKWRVMSRFGIMTLPIVGAYYYSWEQYTRVALYLEDKYGLRLEFYQKTGNPALLNPFTGK